jgi:hypothetical protein
MKWRGEGLRLPLLLLIPGQTKVQTKVQTNEQTNRFVENKGLIRSTKTSQDARPRPQGRGPHPVSLGGEVAELVGFLPGRWR